MPNPLNNLARNDKQSINKAKKNNKRPAIDEPMYDYPVAVSATDMTGLMPTPPQSQDELESYQELAGMPIAEKNRRK